MKNSAEHWERCYKFVFAENQHKQEVLDNLGEILELDETYTDAELLDRVIDVMEAYNG